jgi:PilZ domain
LHEKKMVSMPDGRYHDKRSHRRYPITLEAQCRLLDRDGVELRGGTTLNISSGGILIAINESPDPGDRIEVGLVWPFSLNGSCALKLVIRGQVVRIGRLIVRGSNQSL